VLNTLFVQVLKVWCKLGCSYKLGFQVGVVIYIGFSTVTGVFKFVPSSMGGFRWGRFVNSWVSLSLIE
jgi:hypothetical protein